MRMRTNKQTPLFVAARLGHLDVVKLLTCYGASCRKGVTITGHTLTPLIIAEMCGNAAVHAYLSIVQGGWPVLRMAAESRLSEDLEFMVLEGRLDPDDMSIPEILASRFTACSTDPLGVHRSDLMDQKLPVPLHHHPLDDEARLHFSEHLMDFFRQQAPTPVCRITSKLVKDLTNGWFPRTHRYHNAALRAAVHTMMLISERLHQQSQECAIESGGDAGGDGGGSAVDDGVSNASVHVGGAAGVTDDTTAEADDANALLSTLLPPEIWLTICHFCMRHWWDLDIVKKAIVGCLKACRRCFHNGGLKKTHQCEQCMHRRYCSRKCQKIDWKGGHKEVCQQYDAAGRMLDDEMLRHMCFDLDEICARLSSRFCRSQVEAGLDSLQKEPVKDGMCDGMRMVKREIGTGGTNFFSLLRLPSPFAADEGGSDDAEELGEEVAELEDNDDDVPALI